MLKKQVFIFFLTIIGGNLFAQMNDTYYKVGSFQQTNNDEKTNKYEKLDIQNKKIIIETYSVFDDEFSSKNYNILAQKTNTNQEDVFLAKRIEEEVPNGEIEGDLYMFLVIKESIFDKNFQYVVQISDISEQEGKEYYMSDSLLHNESIEEKAIVSEGYFTLHSFFEKALKLPAMSEDVSEEEFIAILEKIKTKVLEVEKKEKNSGRIFETDAFMIALISEAGYNGFASKPGFGVIFKKYKNQEKVQKLIEEIETIRN